MATEDGILTSAENEEVLTTNAYVDLNKLLLLIIPMVTENGLLVESAENDERPMTNV